MKKQGKKSEIDLSGLSWGTLRRYQYNFKIKTDHPEDFEPATRETLLPLIQEHFDNL